MTKTGRDSDKFMLRLPEGMRAKIKAATGGRRSMNDIVVEALENYFLAHQKRQMGWRWVPPEEQIPDAYRAAIRDQAEKRGTSYGEELNAALVGYYISPAETHDNVAKERIARLVTEIVDIVENEIKSGSKE